MSYTPGPADYVAEALNSVIWLCVVMILVTVAGKVAVAWLRTVDRRAQLLHHRAEVSEAADRVLEAMRDRADRVIEHYVEYCNNLEARLKYPAVENTALPQVRRWLDAYDRLTGAMAADAPMPAFEHAVVEAESAWAAVWRARGHRGESLVGGPTS